MHLIVKKQCYRFTFSEWKNLFDATVGIIFNTKSQTGSRHFILFYFQASSQNRTNLKKHLSLQLLKLQKLINLKIDNFSILKIMKFVCNQENIGKMRREEGGRVGVEYFGLIFCHIINKKQAIAVYRPTANKGREISTKSVFRTVFGNVRYLFLRLETENHLLSFILAKINQI